MEKKNLVCAGFTITKALQIQFNNGDIFKDMLMRIGLGIVSNSSH